MKAKKTSNPGEPDRQTTTRSSASVRATISYAKNNLSMLLDRVRRGETLTIVDRDRPVARLVPIGAAAGDNDDALRELERMGIVQCGVTDPRPLARAWTPVKTEQRPDILEALLEERREDLR